MSGFENAGKIAVPMTGETVDGADRSADLRQIVAAVSTALARPAADGGLPGILERQVEQLLSIRAVRLREIPARYQARLVTPTRTAESIVLNVPTADSRVQAVLEASFDRSRRLDEQDLELLTAAAQLGGLVLEAARARSTPRSAGSDGAAPLIGSTSAMESLRERVERVALTDFTVLIEGESGTGKELVARPGPRVEPETRRAVRRGELCSGGGNAA